MSVFRSVSAPVGGSWRHDWRVCLRVSSTQPCRNLRCETAVCLYFRTRLCSATTYSQSAEAWVSLRLLVVRGIVGHVTRPRETTV